MRLRVTSIALGVTASALPAVSACSTGTTEPKPGSFSSAQAGQLAGTPLRCHWLRWRISCSTRVTSAALPA